MKKILILLFATLCVFAFASCKDNTGGHVCESKCEICQFCTDEECTDSACSEKCQGHVPHEHSYNEATCQVPSTCSCGDTQGNALDCALNETREGLIAGTCKWCGEKLSVKGNFYQYEEVYEQSGNQSALTENYGYGQWMMFHGDGTFTKYYEHWEHNTYSATGFVPSYASYTGTDGATLKINTRHSATLSLVFYEYEGRLYVHDINWDNMPYEFRPYAIDALDLVDADGERYEDYGEQLEQGMTFELYDEIYMGARYKATVTLKLVTAGNTNATQDNPAVIDYVYEYFVTEDFQKLAPTEHDSLVYDAEGDFYKVIYPDLRVEESRALSAATYDEESGILTVSSFELFGGTPENPGTMYFRLYADGTIDANDTVGNLSLDETKDLLEGSPWGKFFTQKGFEDDIYNDDGGYGYVFYEDKIDFAMLKVNGFCYVCYGEPGDVKDSILVYDHPELEEEYRRQLLALNNASSQDGFGLYFYDSEWNKINDETLEASVIFGANGITVTATGENIDYAYTIGYDEVYISLGRITSSGEISGAALVVGGLGDEFEFSVDIRYEVDEEGALQPDGTFGIIHTMIDYDN